VSGTSGFNFSLPHRLMVHRGLQRVMRQASVHCTEACSVSWDKHPYNAPRPATNHETNFRTMNRGLQRFMRQASVQCTEACSESRDKLPYNAPRPALKD